MRRKECEHEGKRRKACAGKAGVKLIISVLVSGLPRGSQSLSPLVEGKVSLPPQRMPMMGRQKLCLYLHLRWLLDAQLP